MSITYNPDTITAIVDGDPITAAILNGPSVDLATRTEEVLRSSNYDAYIREHTSNVLVKLTPTLEGIDPEVILKTTVSSIDGSPTGTYRRYYSASLNGAALSVYTEAQVGGRYVVPGSSISSFFSDSTLIFSIGLFPFFSNRNPENLVDIIPFLATIAVASLKLTPPLQDLFKGITDLRGALPDLEEALKLLDKDRIVIIF